MINSYRALRDALSVFLIANSPGSVSELFGQVVSDFLDIVAPLWDSPLLAPALFFCVIVGLLATISGIIRRRMILVLFGLALLVFADLVIRMKQTSAIAGG